MNDIYIYEGDFEKGDKTYSLMKKAVFMFLSEHKQWAESMGIEPMDVEQAEVLQGEKGKPFFASLPLSFSITHSGRMWMCAVSNKSCGIDLQIVKKTKTEDVAKRFFSPDETHYVELWGQEGFFELWVRKEAFGKLTGEGFFSEMPTMVDSSHDLKKVVELKGKKIFIQDIPISNEIKACLCSEEDNTIQIRSLVW